MRLLQLLRKKTRKTLSPGADIKKVVPVIDVQKIEPLKPVNTFIFSISLIIFIKVIKFLQKPIFLKITRIFFKISLLIKIKKNRKLNRVKPIQLQSLI